MRFSFGKLKRVAGIILITTMMAESALSVSAAEAENVTGITTPEAENSHSEDEIMMSSGVEFFSVSSADDVDFYRSSDYFAVNTSTSQWDGGIWTAQTYDPDTYKYENMTQTITGYNWNKENNGNTDIYAGGINNGVAWNSARAGAYWMAPAALKKTSGGVDIEYKKSAVKTFTAPKKGSISVCFDNKFYAVGDNPANARIILEELNGDVKKVWPKNEEYYKVDKSTALPVSFFIEIEQGDKLHFEVSRPEEKIDEESYASRIYWDPKIIYEDETFKWDYKASDSFSAEKNGSIAWKWQYYDVQDKAYNDMDNYRAAITSFSADGNETAPAWTSTDDDKGVAVGEFAMRASVNPSEATDGEKNGAQRDYAVKTFVAPKRGTVKILADGNEIFARDTKYGSHVRIVLESGEKLTQVWPEEGWANPIGNFVFDELDLNIEMGDKLHFESSFQWVDDGSSPWNSVVHWNPVVSYQDIAPAMISCVPENGAENVSMNFVHVLTYDENIAMVNESNVRIYEAADSGEEIETDAVCSSLIIEDSSVVTLKYTNLKPYTQYIVYIDNIRYESEEVGSYTEKIGFTTGASIEFGEITTESGALVSGTNKVQVSISNYGNEPGKAALLILLCKGTLDSYTVTNAKFVSDDNIDDKATLCVEITVPDIDEYFIKALLLEDVFKARSYMPIKVMKGGA